jgi:HTH-type transcriptional repressor of NAD biosynthesis genes
MTLHKDFENAGSKPEHGLIIGKFKPPHRGHDYLIDTAHGQCRSLTVLVMARADDDIPGALRLQWLKEQHPGKDIRLITHNLPIGEDTPESWKNWTNLIRSHIPKTDVLFSSEEYAVEFARRLGAAHVCVDAPRSHVPVSATKIRTDFARFRDYVSPSVARWMDAHYRPPKPPKPPSPV